MPSAVPSCTSLPRPTPRRLVCVARRLRAGVSLEGGTRGRSVCECTTAVLPGGSYPASLPTRARRRVRSRFLGPAAERAG